jgi:hypothetical protein
LYGAGRCQAGITACGTPLRFLCSAARGRFFVPACVLDGAARSRGQGSPLGDRRRRRASLTTASTAPGSPSTAPGSHRGTLASANPIVQRRPRGELAIGRGHRVTTLYSVDPFRIATMMQSCASAAKLRGDRPNLPERHKVHGSPRVTAASDRHRQFVAMTRTIAETSVAISLVVALMTQRAGQAPAVSRPS